MKQKPFEEFAIGESFTSYARTITEADIVYFTSFAGLKLPLFIDEEFCKEHSPFKTRIAPGLMTASIAAGMMEDILGPYTLAALGLNEFKFSVPVKAGDTLHVDITVENKRDTKNADRGILSSRHKVINQRGETALEFTGTFLMRKGSF
jgi:acyl dehydratase